MKRNTQFLAFGLAMLTIGSMAACNYKPQEVGMQPEEMRQEEMQQQGQPEEFSRSAVSEQTSINALKPGNTLTYYEEQFRGMGYNINEVERKGDKSTYDLSKGNERYKVVLLQPSNARQVQDVQVQQFQVSPVAQLQNDQVIMEVRKLQPGKKPAEYFTQLNKIGQVTEYKYEPGAGSAEMKLNTNKKEYKVNMEVDPTSSQVIGIKMEDKVWTL